jgi:hypothetical protein
MTAVPDMKFNIHPANIPGTTEFNAFTAVPSDCIIQYKFSFDTLNTIALSLLKKEPSATKLSRNIADSLALVITETAPKVKISFAFP